MIEELREIIEEQIVIDIYMRNPDSNECELIYKGFRVTDIDADELIFIGYKEEDIKVPLEDTVYSEDVIDSICEIVRY